MRNRPWLLEPAARIYVGLLFLMICMVIAGGWAKMSHDEHSACVIQARGLPASHQLADSLGDIHTLLTLPAPPGSPPVPKSITAVINDLNMHLANYQLLESGQPQSRTC